MLDLKIITPQKKILEKQVKSVTCQTVTGEITILPRHSALLTLLDEGVVTIKDEHGAEEFFSAGSGYVETNGKVVRILISRAANQNEIDERKVYEAREQAKLLLSEQKSSGDRRRAWAMLQRTSFDLKVLNKLKRKHS